MNNKEVESTFVHLSSIHLDITRTSTQKRKSLFIHVCLLSCKTNFRTKFPPQKEAEEREGEGREKKKKKSAQQQTGDAE